jgi:hypothetical protein
MSLSESAAKVTKIEPLKKCECNGIAILMIEM